ncbi:hypothetical protein [Streptomyces sp. URMC 129]|uniref:hypothetical protein n=1 Tax=Streptomyces sp. URMC 129 TaxID=3423407 RepID=UPI003F19CBFE
MTAVSAGAGVMVTVEVDASTIRRGDQLLVGGQAFTVQDMSALPQGGKRVQFATGEILTLRPTTVLWATRRQTPHRIRTRSGNAAR